MEEIRNYKENELVFREGESATDIYKVIKGRLIVFQRKANAITALGYIESGEYVGEMSFFDENPRSAFVMAIEKTALVQIPHQALKSQIPKWLLKTAHFMSHKLRVQDKAIGQSRIKKETEGQIAPLTNEQQYRIIQILDA